MRRSWSPDSKASGVAGQAVLEDDRRAGEHRVRLAVGPDGHDLQLGAFALVAVAPHEDLGGDLRVLPDLIRSDHADDGHIAADVLVADREDVDGYFHSRVGPRDRLGSIGDRGCGRRRRRRRPEAGPVRTGP